MIAGTALLPFGLSVIPVSGITGVLIAKLGHYQRFVWSGWVISTIGLGVLTLLDRDTSPAAFTFILICAGVGQALLFISHSVAVQASCEPKDIAHATSMFSFMRSFGLCLGVGIGGTILQNFVRQRLQHVGLPLDIAADIVGFVPKLAALPNTIHKELVVEAYSSALRRLFATLSGIGGLGLLLSLVVGNHSLDKANDTTHKLKERVKRLSSPEPGVA